MVNIMRWSYPQEAQDEDNDVTIIPRGDLDAGMPASETKFMALTVPEVQNTKYLRTSVYQRAWIISMKKLRLTTTVAILTVNIFQNQLTQIRS